MRLLLVVPSYYPESYGGAERQASLLAEAMARRGAQVTILAPTLKRDIPDRTPAPFGAIWRLRGRALPARGGRYLASTLAWTWKVRRLILRHRSEFDLVYVFHGRLHVAGPLLGARAARLPIFVKLGAGGPTSDFKALYRKRYLYGHLVAAMKTRWTTGFIAISREVEDDLRGAGVQPQRIHRVPNGVQLVPSVQVEAALAARSGRRFISIGRLVHDKNVDVLLEALAASPGAELTLVGDGPHEGALKALAGRLAVAGRVRFLGALKDPGQELLAHDAFLTASVHEGLSNSLLEALAAGVIPIAAEASGVGELIEDGRTGFVVERPEADGFAADMAKVLSMSAPDRAAMSRAAHAKAASGFAIDGVAGRLLDLFGAAVQGGAP